LSSFLVANLQTWMLVENLIDGSEDIDRFGYSVSMSSDRKYCT